jgi:hypothetical protein
MVMSGSLVWKAVLGVALLGVIVLSTRARAPRRGLSAPDLRRLVVSALCLYAVGGLAWLTHHVLLAVFVDAGGIATAALAAWLSRGGYPDDPPSDGDDPPLGETPPPDPDGLAFDWEAFERDLRDYAERTRAPADISG